MNKVTPKISAAGSIQMPTKGGRNATTNAGMHGSGIAPRPQAGSQQKIAGSQGSAPAQVGLARVKNASTGPAGASNLPVRTNAMRGLTGPKVGQPNPGTGAVATKKPKRKGLGSAFYGEY